LPEAAVIDSSSRSNQDFGQVLSLGLFVKLPDGVGANLGGRGQQVKKLKSSPAG
jgi:hypothetical protein